MWCGEDLHYWRVVSNYSKHFYCIRSLPLPCHLISAPQFAVHGPSSNTSSPTVKTLDPTVIAGGGSFHGQAMSFPTGDNLEVFYKYGEGKTLPATPKESQKWNATALAAGTTIPAYDVLDACSVYSYQVGLELMINSSGTVIVIILICFICLHRVSARHALEIGPLGVQ